jgi:CubicO group peptidase (beta-lactamase class C family)
VGKGTYYSNANYSILGAIIESASGQRYEDYIRKHIFDPLNMTHRYTSEEVAKQHGLATGYRYWFGRPFAATDIPHGRGDLPGAYLISCAKDMGNYLVAHMNGGTFGTTRVLSSSGASKLHTPEKKNLNYAMGWSVWTTHGTRAIGHNGVTPTSYVGMRIFPEYQRGFVLLINAQNFLSGPAVSALPDFVGLNVIGQMAFPVAKAPRVHTDLALLCALLLGQVIGSAVGGRQVYRWRKYPDTRPRRKRWVLSMRAGLAFTVDIGIALGMLWWVPCSREAPLSCVMLYAPDAGWLLLLNGTLALISCAVSVPVTAFLFQQCGYIKAAAAEGVGSKTKG